MMRASEETDGPGMMGVRCVQGESSSINRAARVTTASAKVKGL